MGEASEGAMKKPPKAPMSFLSMASDMKFTEP
jgi:hypothetical protein